MKMKGMSSLFCAVAIFGTASVAMAGAYGEAEQAEEMPRSAPAVAETVQVEEFEPFLYIAAGGLYGQEFFDKGAHQINQTYGWGLNARVGYRFHPNVAVELLYENVIEFDADSGSRQSSKQGNIDRSVWTLMPNAKIYFLEGFCEPYVSIGGGLVSADDGYNNRVLSASPAVMGQPVDDGYGFGMRFGLGADFYATENIFITPEVAYVLPLTSNVATYDHLNVGLGIGYAFN